jgi:cell division septal protein FtsQ
MESAFMVAKRLLFGILFLTTVFTSSALAQQLQQQRTIKLLGVSVEGNETTDANMIRLSTGLTPGTEVTGEGIQ